MPPGYPQMGGMSAPPTQGSLNVPSMAPPMGPPMYPPMGMMGPGSGPLTAPGSAQSLGGMGGPMMGGPPSPMMGGLQGPPMGGGPGMNPYMGAPMNGFGPSMMGMPGMPEIRHAPHADRPENAEVPEHQKVVKNMPMPLATGDTIPHGSDKFALYGALEDLHQEHMAEQKEQLSRRRRVNCVPALNALFLPWVMFLTVFSLASFYVHYAMPFCTFMFNSCTV